MSIIVDETLYNKKSYSVPKETSDAYGPENDEPDNHKLNVDPFLLYNSMIMTG